MGHSETTKIQQCHLDRLAYVYVRQSSLYQVQHNTASTARQYNLVERAKELGWPDEKIIVVDQDQGQSGASLEGRDGFKIMLREILIGNVGAVLSLEASRLARDSSDWHQLVKLCTTRNTLIIDELGINNPRAFNDRLLLSIKGTLSDAELHLITSRLDGGRLQCAKEGRLRFKLPAGYIYNSTGSVILHPSPEVQQIIRLFFDQYDRLGSGAGLVRYFRTNNLLVPNHYYDGPFNAKTIFVPLGYHRALKMLHNPAYAGLYVYGQTRNDIQILSPESLQTVTRRVKVAPDEWAVVIRDAHEAYISEDRFWRNIQRLKDNRSLPSTRGVAYRGSALLQGLVRCGVCGRRMHVKYPNTNSRSPVYCCPGERHLTGTDVCQYIAASKVDPELTELVLEALAPAQLELSKSAINHLEAETNAIRDQWRIQIVEADHDAEMAGHLFKQAAAQNRHVAAQLQDEWEQSLKRLEELKQSERNLPDPPSRSSIEKALAQLTKLTENLRTVWDSPSTETKDRKELLRLLITDVILIRRGDLIHATVRWASGGRQEIEIPWLRTHRIHPEVIQLVREMSPTHTARVIAETLNSMGYRRRYGQREFTALSVRDLRKAHKIPDPCLDQYPRAFSGPRGDGRYCVRDLADVIGCSKALISLRCKDGKLDAIRSTSRSPWWIKVDATQIREMAQEIRSRREGCPQSGVAKSDVCVRGEGGHH